MVVSVVIPVKDREKSIGRAISSVLAQEAECAIELIIVDDASSDKSKKIVKEYCEANTNIQLIENNKSLGGAAARNIGGKKASGDYIAFLDSDDEWLPGHLGSCLKSIFDSKAQGCFGSFVTSKDGKIIKFDLPLFNGENIINYIFEQRGDTRTSTFLFERHAFLKIMFDDDLAKHQDWDLAIRFSECFFLTHNAERTVKLYIDVDNRMSNSNNYKASTYFLEKHKSKLSKQALYNFKLSICFNAFRKEYDTAEFRQQLNELTALANKYKVNHGRKYFILKNRIPRLGLSLLFRVSKIIEMSK